MKIQNALVSNILDRSQRYFAHVTTVTLSWRVQNIVVIGRVYFTLECFEFSSNFEFDRNMLSGTGARTECLNSSPPGQNGCHLGDNILKCIFMNEKFYILIQISLTFVPMYLIDSRSALVQVMAWRRTGDKPLPEPMQTQLTDAYMRHYELTHCGLVTSYGNRDLGQRWFR